jgi:hypothetical protein
VPLGLGEAFLADAQYPTELEQRVVLVAAASEGLLLHAAADVVDRGVGELAHVEVIQHQLRVGEPHLGVGQRRAVRRRRVERRDPHALPPGGRLGGQPVA